MVLTIPISSIADMGRTACSVTAAATASTIVARQEGDLNEDVLYGRKEYEDPDDNDGGGLVTPVAVANVTDGSSALDIDEEKFEVPTGECCPF
jgi:hypothetical protein